MAKTKKNTTMFDLPVIEDVKKGMKPFEYYRVVGMEYPDASKFQTYYFYKSGELWASCSGTNAEEVRHLKGMAFKEGWTEEKCFDRTPFHAEWDKYRQLEAQKLEEFKQDLFDDLGIQDNPKKEFLFSKAWDRGHSCGFSEVYNEALDLVELIS